MSGECYVGDCRAIMKDMIAAGTKVQCVVTSPPYWGLRDYGAPGQFGLERTPIRYLARMRYVLRLVREILEDDGTLWLNMGDSYAGAPGGLQGKNGERSNRRFTGRISVDKRRRDQLELKPKDMAGMPWMLALVLRADGWWLRQEIIWHKPNPMPESTKDRCTKAHEHIFLLSKSERYYYDQDAIKEPATGNAHSRGAGVNPKAVAGWADDGEKTAVAHAGSPKYRGQDKEHRTKQGLAASERKFKPRAKQNESFSAAVKDTVLDRNKRSVWTIATEPYPDAHFATFPRALVEPCILAGSRPGDVVFDPFMGSGTVAQVAEHLGRRWLGCELNPEYIALQKKRLAQMALQF